MPTFQTPYGTVDAPDLGAAQKWIANQKGNQDFSGGTTQSFWQRLIDPKTIKDTLIPKGLQDLPSASDLWHGLMGLPAEAQQQAQLHQGQTLAQRARDPTEMQKAIGVALSVNPLPIGRMPMHPAPSLPTPAQSLQQDFQAQGVPASVPVVGQGRGVGMAAQASRLLPASPVAAGMQRTAQGTQQAVERAAAGFGGAANAEQAGGVIQRAMRRMAADKSQAATDYGEFDRLMHGAPPAPATHVIRALNDLYAKFLNNPELDDIFNDPKLSRIRQAVEPHQVTIPAQTSPILGAGGQPIITRAAQTITRGGTLPIQDLKLLRTRIGYLLERPPGVAPAEIPKADLNRVYKALTQDLHTAARARSPAAAKALAVASGNYSMRAATLEALEKVLGKPDEPGVASERFFNRMNSAAQQGGQTNAGLLMRARRMMQPGEWQEIGAATIRRLGTPTAGARDVLADNFSVSSFATNWNKLTPKAKDLLFGADTPGSPRAGLEQLSRIAQAQKNVGKLSNVSHSGEVLGIIRLVEGVVAAVAAGHFPWAVGMGLGGAYGVSKLLMSPGFTRWLYQAPRLARPAAGGMLPPAALVNAGEALHQSLMNPGGPPSTPEPEQRKQAPPQFRTESTNP